MRDAPLPLVDIAPLRDINPAARRRAAAALGEACRGPGFFLATGHGIPEATQAGLFAAARAFFARPLAEKAALSIRHSPHNRGYVGLAEEQLDPTRPQQDHKEAFNIGLDLAPEDPEVRAGAPFRGVNLWPAIPGWRETMLDWFAQCWALGRLLHRGFALDLGLDEAFFEPLLDRPMATLRLLRYPGGGGPAQPGAGRHTDYGNCTILATDGVPGLEIQRRDGDWIAAPQIPGALVCNIGDCLMRWSNGVYASTPHRVAAPAAERFSAAFFLDANPEAWVAALPGTGTPRWPAVTAGDYLKQRLDATYAHRRGEA